MQTRIAPELLATAAGQTADRILRACVHCGFCTATCPTYQLLGDELDSPRGRIYLIKQMLEGNPVTRKTQQHLDRCLTCRSCETTCPSGVEYGKLVDIGRALIEKQVKRPALEAIQRKLLRQLVPYPARLAPLLKIGRILKPVLPAALKVKLPHPQPATPPVQAHHPRKMLVLQGCVQSIATPETNAAAARILDRLGIELVIAHGAGCCGAVSQHLAAPDEAQGFMRRNIDAWWPYVEAGVEAIVITASGCGAMVKEYGDLLKQDEHYAEKAARIGALAKDIGEILLQEDMSMFRRENAGCRVAFHSPCTLQHGQKINGVVETILDKAGFELVPVADAHLCCGSAGTYSLLQEALSQRLRDNKISALEKNLPDVIATANIGCQLHLAARSRLPVKHWIELLDEIAH